MSNALAIEAEVDQNYEAFRPQIGGLISEKRKGQYALMRKLEIIEFFDSAGGAYRAGKARFKDRLFSVQEVTDRPFDLGYFSHGGPYTDV